MKWAVCPHNSSTKDKYQKGKQKSCLKKPNETQPNDKCGNCGNKGHTSKLNDRRKNCPAFDKTCTKCKTNGHFAAHCRGGPRETRDKSKSKDTKVNEVKAADADNDKNTEDAQLGTLSGSWMLLNGLQDPAWEG